LTIPQETDLAKDGMGSAKIKGVESMLKKRSGIIALLLLIAGPAYPQFVPPSFIPS
jgi:hypothetical protein